MVNSSVRLSSAVRKDTLLAHRRCYLSSLVLVARSLLFWIKPRTLYLSLLYSLLSLLFYSSPVVAIPVHAQQSTTTNVASGLTFSTELLQTPAGPERVSLLAVDLTATCLGVVQAHDALVSSDETVSSMANRTAALAGVNGDYFEINGPGRPISMVVRNGELLQSPTVYPVLGVNSAGKATISAPSFSGQVITDHASYALKSVNVYNDASKGDMVLITPALGAAISVKNDTVALLWHVADTPEAFTVQSVRSDEVSLPALVGESALVAGGAAGRWLANNLQAGTNLTITKQISPDDSLVQAIGGGPQVVRNGALYNDPNPPAPKTMTTRNPLTAVAITRDGMHALFAAFNGRFADTQKSRGLTPAEAGKFMLAHGAFQAMLFDGGGSSELVARLPGQHQVSIMNVPSDGRERPVANGLFVYSAAGGDASHPFCEHKSAA